MNKTLKISFSLKNTYRVNGILFSLKQIPLVKKLLPATLYQVTGLKTFANVLSVLWEIVSVFLGKLLYFFTMVCGVGILYQELPQNQIFLHILLYKQPKFVLKLFQIRLREIMKINAVPALIIGGGLALLLYVSGGTEDPLNYLVLVVSILCMSLFFSVHYLTIYYLLQPYNAGTELKSGTYRLVLSVTYMICFFLMQLRMPILVFGMMTIVFCVVYSIAACILVYKLAPKTFKLRT